MEATIAKIRKSATSEIWVCLREYQDRQYVDVREHFLSGDDHQWRPTKKGVMVKPELLPQVIDGIELLEGVTELGTVATISKSKRDELQVGFREFGKARYAELRLWYQSETDEGKKPSPKGVTFKLDLVDSLADALRIAHEQLVSEKSL